MEGQTVAQIASSSVLIGHAKQSFERPFRHESLKLIIIVYNLPISIIAFTFDSILLTSLTSKISYLHIVIVIKDSNSN